MRAFVMVRDLGATYEARFWGLKATATSSPLSAAIAVVEKNVAGRTDWFLSERLSPEEVAALKESGDIRPSRFRTYSLPLDAIFFEVIGK